MTGGETGDIVTYKHGPHLNHSPLELAVFLACVWLHVTVTAGMQTKDSLHCILMRGLCFCITA